jgi:hypothetical protein
LEEEAASIITVVEEVRVSSLRLLLSLLTFGRFISTPTQQFLHWSQ